MPILRLIEQLLIRLLVFLCRFWQILLSPLAGERCRFYPTCSRYAEESLRRHGLLRGSYLSVKRLCRCHPLAQGGVDLVPEVDSVVSLSAVSRSEVPHQ